jgi:hypothetical protein
MKRARRKNRAPLKFFSPSISEIGIRELSWILMRIGLQIKVLPEDPSPTWEKLQERNRQQRKKGLREADNIIAQKLSKL